MLSMISSSVDAARRLQMPSTLLKTSLYTETLTLLCGLLVSCIYSLRVHCSLQQFNFIVMLQLLQNAKFPLIVTFLLQEQQQWYLFRFVTPRILPVRSFTVEMFSTGWRFSVKLATDDILHSSSSFGYDPNNGLCFQILVEGLQLFC